MQGQQLPGRRVKESMTEQVNVVMPPHLNGYNKLFGGQLAVWIDIVAGVCAARHSRCKITTAAIDNLRFRDSVGQGELVILRARVTHTGHTSLEVRVDSYVEDVKTGVDKLINTAFVIEVALDENDKPCPVPPLILETEQEKRDFEAGIRRREMRLAQVSTRRKAPDEQ